MLHSCFPVQALDPKACKRVRPENVGSEPGPCLGQMVAAKSGDLAKGPAAKRVTQGRFLQHAMQTCKNGIFEPLLQCVHSRRGKDECTCAPPWPSSTPKSAVFVQGAAALGRRARVTGLGGTSDVRPHVPSVLRRVSVLERVGCITQTVGVVEAESCPIPARKALHQQKGYRA